MQPGPSLFLDLNPLRVDRQPSQDRGDQSGEGICASSAGFTDYPRQLVIGDMLDVNPMADVPWPERSTTQALKQLLFPREFLALVSCPDVPVVRARLYAVTLFTTTRAAEVRVFDCAHFDLVHGSVQILMSDDPTTRKATGATSATKSTKGGKARLTTLEANLSPLVAAMASELDGAGRLFPDRPKNTPKGNQWRPATAQYIPGPDGEYGVCGTFKRDLRAALDWAGIPVRPELFDDSDRRASLSIRFHDLRASGITWRRARRDNPAAILQECGHEDQATNEIYIRALRGLSPAELFPALPARLLGPGNEKPRESPIGSKPPHKDRYFVGAEGLEDVEHADIASLHVGLAPTDSPRVDVSARQFDDVGPIELQTACTSEDLDLAGIAPQPANVIGDDASATEADDPLEAALLLAAKAGRFDVVALLSREIEARRLSREPNVIPLRRRKG